jgi:glycosyltransferase involved in cell wall biosynthesis
VSGSDEAAMQTELSIILVNWNSMNYLRECLKSLYETTKGVSFEVIVVDSASPQRDIENLPQEFPEAILVQSQKNVGFAGANNLGFAKSKSPILPESRHADCWPGDYENAEVLPGTTRRWNFGM